MSRLNYDIERLKENEICGAESFNLLIDYVLNFKSLSEFLTLNPDGQGSYTIDLDFAALAAAIIGGLPSNVKLNFDFACNIDSSNHLTVSAGKIFLPDRQIAISAYNTTISSGDSGKMVYVRMTDKNHADIVVGSAVTHTLQTGNNDFRVTLPIATINIVNSTWQMTYHHIGSFHITQEPYFYISGYNKAANQSLDHAAGYDGLQWNTYGECQQ